MKYFLSNKESNHLNYTKLSDADLDNMDGGIDEELVVFPGTVESYADTSGYLQKIKKACGKGCKINFNFINIYQLFNDVAFHRVDIGIGHLVCKSLEKPFNVNAATNAIKENGFTINRVSLEDHSKFIRIECTNE